MFRTTLKAWVRNFWKNKSYSFLNIFVVAAVASILIALITISFQTIRAAVVNPIRSLRSE